MADELVPIQISNIVILSPGIVGASPDGHYRLTDVTVTVRKGSGATLVIGGNVAEYTPFRAAAPTSPQAPAPVVPQSPSAPPVQLANNVVPGVENPPPQLPNTAPGPVHLPNDTPGPPPIPGFGPPPGTAPLPAAKPYPDTGVYLHTVRRPEGEEEGAYPANPIAEAMIFVRDDQGAVDAIVAAGVALGAAEADMRAAWDLDLKPFIAKMAVNGPPHAPHPFGRLLDRKGNDVTKAVIAAYQPPQPAAPPPAPRSAPPPQPTPPAKGDVDWLGVKAGEVVVIDAPAAPAAPEAPPAKAPAAKRPSAKKS